MTFRDLTELQSKKLKGHCERAFAKLSRPPFSFSRESYERGFADGIRASFEVVLPALELKIKRLQSKVRTTNKTKKPNNPTI